MQVTRQIEGNCLTVALFNDERQVFGWGTLLFALARKYPERPVIDLQKKLSYEQHANTLLISSTFTLPDREPTTTKYLDDLYNMPIYIYGEWLPEQR